jgi:hypothetical protein
VLSSTLYVTVASTAPSIPSDELDESWIEKVMESSVKSSTCQLRNDQLLVPLCSVLPPSFFSVKYVLSPMV